MNKFALLLAGFCWLLPACALSQTQFSLNGRMALEAAEVIDGDGSPLQDHSELRYAWLGVNARSDTGYMGKLSIGFEESVATPKDVILGYDKGEGYSAQIGHFYENNGLELMGGNLSTIFIERSSALTTFRPTRRLGVSIDPYGENWGVQLGVFGNSPWNDGDRNAGYSIAGRVHVAPIRDKTNTLHLGLVANHRERGDGDDRLRFRSRGESHVIEQRLIDTGNLRDVNTQQLGGVELLWQHCTFSLMGEYGATQLRGDATDATVHGGYLSAAYVWGAPPRSYDGAHGIYGRVIPAHAFDPMNGTWGALELAGRISHVDLNDGTLRGGQLDAITLGINWYAHERVRTMLNYVINDVQDSPLTPDTSPHTLMLRLQLDF